MVSSRRHEIRNSLAPIQNAIHFIRRSAGDHRSQTAVREADSQLDVLKRLADDLVDIVRLESGKVELEKEPVRAPWLSRSAVLSR